MSESRATSSDLVIYQRTGHVGRIVLNRPEKRNALNPAVWQALDEAVTKAEQDEEARVILLKGEGVSFSAGLDLSPDNELFVFASQGPSARNKVLFYKEVRKVQGIHTRLERLIKPTIAVIQKHCLGAGLELALCCDIRLATADAVFAVPEVKLGFVMDIGGLQRLNRVVGRARAREIVFRAHRFDAKHAADMGLLNGTWPDPEALEAAALEMAEEIASHPPLAVQGAKEVMMYDEEAPSLDASLDYNAARSSMIVPSDDISEAITAYLEGRKGEFKGA